MDKGFISIQSVKTSLSDNMKRFIEFADQVIHDKEFLECVDSLLPFGGVAHASMNVVAERQPIKKMGLIIMRMDMEPPLFSLAVNLTIGKGGEETQDNSVFLTACKTIEELQKYVNRKVFGRDVIAYFDKEFMSNDSPLQEIALLSKNGKNNNV